MKSDDAVRSGSYFQFPHIDPRLPKISTKLLGIHAAVAELMHMTGAGELIDKLLRDWEQIEVLSEDGADAELLRERLQLVAMVMAH